LDWSLTSFGLVLQSSVFDGVVFDPFSFKQDGLASAEVDIGRRQVLTAFVIAVLDEATKRAIWTWKSPGMQ
jgi:hypothetical protein